jgi:hypothetical protein
MDLNRPVFVQRLLLADTAHPLSIGYDCESDRVNYFVTELTSQVQLIRCCLTVNSKLMAASVCAGSNQIAPISWKNRSSALTQRLRVLPRDAAESVSI